MNSGDLLARDRSVHVGKPGSWELSTPRSQLIILHPDANASYEIREGRRSGAAAQFEKRNKGDGL
jgi:hypothetical protein